MSSDSILIKRCKKRDKNAFVELFKRYEKYVYSLCYRYTYDEQDSMDMVQEIFIKVFKNIDKFQEHMPFHPWIRKITVNTCINFKKCKKSNVISINQEYGEDSTLEETIPDDMTIDKEIERFSNKEIIDKALKILKPDQKLVIMLRYYEDLPYEEIGVLINKPIGTVKTDIHRAKIRMRDYIREIGGDLI